MAIIEFAILLVLFAMLLALIRAISGRTVYDKILAVNIFGTITVLFIAVYGFMTERPDFLDIALAYTLINFVTTIAVLKFFEYGDMGRSSQQNQQDIDI